MLGNKRTHCIWNTTNVFSGKFMFLQLMVYFLVVPKISLRSFQTWKRYFKKMSSFFLDKFFQIVVTNSLPQKRNTDFFGSKMEVVDISGMVSEYIRRSHYNESVSVLSSNYTPGLKEVFRQQHRQQSSASVVGIISIFAFHNMSREN